MEVVGAERLAASKRPLLTNWRQFTLGFYWLTFNIQWTALINLIIPIQILAMVGEESKGSTLGLVTMLGASISLIGPPLIGAISDRTWTRFGRRRPYMFWGSLVDGLGLLLMAFIPLWLGMPWALVCFILAVMLLQFGSSLATAPYAALIPDVVPLSQRGIASGWFGLMTILGNFFGGMMGLILAVIGGVTGAYWLLLGLFVVGALITILGVREPTPTAPKPFERHEFWRGFWQPLRSHNFRWVFITRLLVLAGQWTVMAFLLYYFRDSYFSLGHPPIEVFGLTIQGPEQGVSLFLVMLLAGAIISSWLGGLLSDTFGRKPMVYAASSLMSFVAIVFTTGVLSSFGGVLWLGVIFGLGYGAFTSVDWALACDVLPSGQDHARDMGVWHIASMIPQVMGVPIAGVLLDTFQKVGQSTGIHNLGYTVIFAMACIYFLLGTVFISRLRGVR